jgi:hypothetical protein
MNYFITAISYLPHKKQTPSRCFGYFSSLERAQKAVKNNENDLEECLYNYLIIEKIRSGLNPFTDGEKDEWWYKWDDSLNKWVWISEAPNFASCICNWALG